MVGARNGLASRAEGTLSSSLAGSRTLNPFSGEKHVAEVLTAGGVVVELQRSSIEPEEVRARESFYQRMVWIIGRTRGEFDPVRFGLSRKHPDENGVVNFH